jgi:predicted helicase
MTNPDPFRAYLQELQNKLSTGDATEHTHRPALQRLIEALAPDLTVINEPRRIECGAPDYIITRAQTPIGYVEAKDIGASLDHEERSDQMRRYRESLNNLILTDYLEFRWYVEGEQRAAVRLASLALDGSVKRSKDGAQALADLFQRFFGQGVATVGRPRELAQRMATLTRMIRELIEETFNREAERGSLHAQLEAFRETLIPDLTPVQFADMYAQTIAYGLFAARVRVTNGHTFTREKAAWNLPKTNPFLRRLFHEIAGPSLDERVAWLVDDLAHLLARADMAEILRDFGKRTRQEDPVVHFYETFLAAYDPEMRQTRGVYYTPEPVVSYIVRSLDHLIKTRFNLRLGLADTRVLVLDPAAGTATFLYFVIQQIHETLMAMGQAGAWNDYVEKYLLPRVFGFELLMAPYAMAHMKLGVQLQETGYHFAGDQRLGIYLTNTLEEAITRAQTLGFAGFITREANDAAEIKRDKPIMVVLGNPPYSVSSANKGDYIEGLMERYKAAVRGERNIQPLSDDYIKFIRFAHDRIERTGYGIVGMITNHTYLSGLIHRGVREELLKTFSEIYVLDLHGSSLLGETTPEGGKDENVFDIQQGVAIILAVKQPTTDVALAEVYHADLWGKREVKYAYLAEYDVSSTTWQELEPQSTSNFFFVPKDFDLEEEYDRGWSMKDIFVQHAVGLATRRDKLLIDFDKHELISRFQALASNQDEDVLRNRYEIRDTPYWNLENARKQIRLMPIEDFVQRVFYRPFDSRCIYYNPRIIERGDARWPLMRHMLQRNLALITSRIIKGEEPHHAFVSKHIVEKICISPKTSNNAFVFPLYLYTTPEDTAGTLFATQETTREPNLSPQFIAAVMEKLDLNFIPDGKGDLQTTFGPEDIFHYAYAVFHSPTYRERYAEFLKIDFPRLPLTSDRGLFKALAEKGEELVALHLMQAPALDHLITKFDVPGSNQVERIRYAEPHRDGQEGQVPGRVYINQTQYFEGIEPEVWEFQIGGYQVLNKWLKDRKGRKLSFDDIIHYQKIVVALKETMRLMEEIDALIPSWPIE